MKLYSENKNYKLYQGNMLDMLEVIEPNSIDSVITDPPYELNFMGKGWDNAGVSFQVDTWKKCYEVLKPGGYLLAFGGSRTFHRIACAIEDAGFEIRDTIMWLYGSGFPKSMNIGLAIDKKNGVESKIVGQQTVPDIRGDAFGTMNEKQGGSYKNITRDIKEAQNEWQGWGTALKPSFEPIIVARKPFKGSLVDNVIEYGVGGINIDECRIGNEIISIHNAPKGTFAGGEYGRGSDTESYRDSIGRFPANTIIDEEVALSMPMGSQTGKRSQKSINNCIESRKQKKGNSQCDIGGNIDHITEYNDSGSVSRYFYCAKASKKDRDEGLDDFNQEKVNDGRQTPIDNAFQRGETLRKNIHPTVKPTELMQYLVRLVSPNGATILDPFNGSGSTGKAVMYENKERNKNYKYIGIELTEEYLPIAKTRIEYVCKDNNLIENLKENTEDIIEGQTNIFEMLYPTYKIRKPIRLIELFSGYGSQALALKYLGINFEHWKICEWAVKSIQAYKDIHFAKDNTNYSKEYSLEDITAQLFFNGISSNYNEPMKLEQIKRLNEKQQRNIFNNIMATHNLVNIQTTHGSDLEIVDTDKYCYVMTYSFPCQDLSLAGLGKGMSDTSTRSGMLWEVERILTECKELGTMPQILLMENVPQVHGADNVEDFNKWQLRLEELGYKNYWQDLIATDYGIPQTRNRTFMVSILGDYNYTFPKPISLKLKLKDMLENEVNKKYYLENYQIENIKKSTYCQNQRRIQSEEVCDTLCARDWKDPKCVIRKNKICKLIPKECFRLMGVKDEDFDKVAKNQSDSSLYHLAGDSIVVNVLMAIFKELL